MKKILVVLLLFIGIGAHAQIINDGFWVKETTPSSFGPIHKIYGSATKDKDLGEITISLQNINFNWNIRIDNNSQYTINAKIKITYEFLNASDDKTLVKKQEIKTCTMGKSNTKHFPFFYTIHHNPPVRRVNYITIELLDLMLNDTHLIIDATLEN